ncbi:glycosyltransferase [Arthrospiribacter ruber]|nr:glycosyltransferase [Arthrospiribacter ruber]
MSFYKKDNPKYFEDALESLHKQTLKASEIVLIQDGEISGELESIVIKWEKVLPIRRIINEENLGLGYSLKLGLEACSEKIVARMDADDIAHPKRFEMQLNYLKNNPQISVVGSWIAEFSAELDNINTYRTLPSEPEVLYKFAKKRCPLNHPTVMYRKEDVLFVGSYDNFRFQQDYHLWGRLLNSGFKIANIPTVLLFMRANNELFGRRGGLEYFKNEVAVQKDFLKIGFISEVEYLRNYFIRGTVRVMPIILRKYFYQHVLR